MRHSFLLLFVLCTGAAYSDAAPASQPATRPVSQPTSRPTSHPTTQRTPQGTSTSQPIKRTQPTPTAGPRPKPTTQIERKAPPKPALRSKASQDKGPLTSQKAQVRAFVDKQLKSLMARYHIPGVLVSIVEGDETIVSKGYGIANLKQDATSKVSGASTLFRVGSLSKVVTATAVMKMMDKRGWKPQMTLSQLLGKKTFQVSRAYKTPVTLHHLLTHTSGFDVTDIGDAAKTPKQMLPLGRYLSLRMTPQVAPPGRYHIYTNQGYALLGSLLETGWKPFSEVMTHLLFAPLGMTKSSFAQPPRADQKKALSRGFHYSMKHKRYKELPLDYSQVGPADALLTTADDMTRFMKFHLTGKSVAGRPYLKQKTLALMHKRQFGYVPATEGHAYGFREAFFSKDISVHGPRRALYHTGGQLGFTSIMVLVPAWKLGVFICQNRRASVMRRRFLKAFFHKWYPKPAPRKTLAPVSKPDYYLGTYLKVGYPSHTVESVVYLIQPSAMLRVTKARGTLRLDLHGALKQQEHGVLQTTDRKTLVAFSGDKQASHMYIGLDAYRRITWWQNPQMHRDLLFLMLLLFASAFLQWFLELFLLSKGHTNEPTTLMLKRLTRLTALIYTVYLLGLVAMLLQAAGQGWDYGLPLFGVGLLMLPYMGGMVAIGLWQVVTQGWARGTISLPWRLYAASIALAALLSTVIISHWHLMLGA